MDALPVARTPMENNFPASFPYIPEAPYGSRESSGVKTTSPSTSTLINSRDSPKRQRHSKRHSKRRSKSSKHYRKRRIGAYVLQIIGIVCLVLAAVKSFEPLTGAGITLVLVGYRELNNSADLDTSGNIHRQARSKDKGNKTARKQSNNTSELVHLVQLDGAFARDSRQMTEVGRQLEMRNVLR